MAFSLKHEKVIDMENALKHPLGPIPLSIIANADGTARVTKKSALAKIILDHLNPSTETATTNKGTFIVDFIAQIRTMKNIPDTWGIYFVFHQILTTRLSTYRCSCGHLS